MRRVVGLVLLSIFVVASLSLGAEAQRRRRGNTRAQPPRIATSTEIEPAVLGAVGEKNGWGASSQKIRQHFRQQVEERYREPLAKATGSMESDRIVAQKNAELARLAQDFIVFNGSPTGWESSFVGAHFTHNNREAMLVRRDENSQNFYFFIQNRLWKWFKAFDASVFQGQTFDQFAEALQARFGRTVTQEGIIPETRTQGRWLEWQDRTTRLRAVDLTQFYGFYCLVFEDKETAANLDTLRVNQQARDEGGHPIVRGLVNAPPDTSEGGANPVDAITGHNRGSQRPSDAGVGNAPSMTTPTPAMTNTTMQGTASDPFDGMDL